MTNIDLEYCGREIIKFLKEEFKNKESLHNQLGSLKNWSFSWLSYDETYWNTERDFLFGRLRCTNFDEDNTRLMNLIYYVLFYDKLPELNSFDDIGHEKYRGETIHAFNWLFQDNLLGIKWYVDFTDENKDFYFKVLQFREKYTTIGNFMLLPNFKLQETSTLNKLKGSAKYHDYADLFFMDLYSGKLKEYRDCNNFYFSEIDTFKKFCELNYLTDYMDDLGNPKLLYNNNKVRNICWKLKKIKKENYKTFALNYMQIASNIITRRANLMCNELEKRLKNL